MGGAAAVVDVDAVRLVKDSDNICTQAAQDNWCNSTVGAVGAVHNNLQAVELGVGSANNVLNIQLRQVLFVNNAADAAAAYCLIIINRRSNDSGNFILHRVRQLVACLRKELDAVVLKRVVRCRNYYAGVGLDLAREEGNRRSRHYTQKVGVAACTANACSQSAFEHLTAATGIPADDNLGAGNLPAKIFCRSIAQLKGQLRGELDVRYAANAVCTK